MILKKSFHYCCNLATLGILMYLEYNLSLPANALKTNLVYLIIFALPTPNSFPILRALQPNANFAEYQYHCFMYCQCFSILYRYALCMVSKCHQISHMSLMSCKNQHTTCCCEARHLAYTLVDTSHPIIEQTYKTSTTLFWATCSSSISLQ